MLLKKTVSLVSCLALAAALLAGCSSGSSSSKPSSSSGAQSGSSSMSGSMSGSASGGIESGMSKVESDVSSAISDGKEKLEGSSSMAGSSSAAAAAAAADEWATRLVNAANPLPEDFSVKTVDIEGYENRPFDARAATALEEMLADAEAAGNKLYLVSGYRSVARQKALFERKVASFTEEGLPREQAEKNAAQWVARPGTSEHNLGLAADIVSADWYSNHSDLTADFEQTPQFAWLKAHCAEYGFILRYPQGKESVTGVTYDPWHYRYVGREAARIIMQRGITLEEYEEL